MAILSNIIYKFNEITIKILTSFFTELVGGSINKLIWNHKTPRITRAIPRKKRNWKHYILSGPMSAIIGISRRDYLHCWPVEKPKGVYHNRDLTNGKAPTTVHSVSS